MGLLATLTTALMANGRRCEAGEYATVEYATLPAQTDRQKELHYSTDRTPGAV
jgi:hypothetical protein